jgi:hypothetical protein
MTSSTGTVRHNFNTNRAARFPSSAPAQLSSRARLGPLFRKTWRLVKALDAWFPLSWLARLAIPVAWVMTDLGFHRKDQILEVVGVGGLALVGVTTLLVLGTALWLRLRRAPAPEAALCFEAGHPFRTGFTLGRLRWIPLVHFDIGWEDPQDVQVRLVPGPAGPTEEVTASARAFGDTVVRKITVSDVFGLARFSVRRRVNQPVIIKPDRGQVQPFRLLPQNANGDQIGHPEGKPEGDLIEMRPYARGDP